MAEFKLPELDLPELAALRKKAKIRDDPPVNKSRGPRPQASKRARSMPQTRRAAPAPRYRYEPTQRLYTLEEAAKSLEVQERRAGLALMKKLAQDGIPTPVVNVAPAKVDMHVHVENGDEVVDE